VAKHFRSDQWARDPPNGCDISNNNYLRWRQSRGDHVHAATKCCAHSLNSVLSGVIANFN
jgi:hypothetical protein